ncbi:Ubiquitin carboxyl-terminal hydrolase [Thalictrum thalictroides]|uniref:ubiquitinyl hydrolase 1 n=1 Tax=Thalictrum thalictroides TaxID=46969 RepID=A0A7J6VMJ4_THATH|nr:Ubiquitin carboxyl-terminal hydrolase [Thalictrum thalictroides]
MLTFELSNTIFLLVNSAWGVIRYEIVLWNKTTRLTLTARDLFNELSRSVKPVSPLPFVMDLSAKYPQYAQLKDNVPMQQDAEECWTRVLETLSQTLTSNSTMPVKEIFGIDLVCSVHCAETGEESLEEESVYSVKCDPLYNVNLLEGLNLGLKSKVERVSPKLGHNTVYDKESRINGLPRYLTVHFARFILDKEKNIKEKSLQKVEYPFELDVYELCSDELQKKLESCRQMSRYKLLAVLSHIGTCPNSGHYIAWVKQESTGQWFSFDDHVVTPVSHEEITKLSGGGDGHMAYICMYKACL